MRLFLIAALAGLALLICYVGWQSEVGTTEAQNAAAQAQQNVKVVAQVQRKVEVLGVHERVTELPEDGQGWHFTLLLNRDWKRRPADRRLVAWCRSYGPIVSVNAQCHSHVYSPGSPIYKERMQPITGGQLPAVLIQDAAGNPVYCAAPKAYGRRVQALPRTPAEMRANMIVAFRLWKRWRERRRDWREYRRDRRRDGGEEEEAAPPPVEEEAPSVDVDVDVYPGPPEVVEKEAATTPYGILAIVIVVSIVGTGIYQLRRP